MPPMDRFEGKTVLVTGVASGIGQSCAARAAPRRRGGVRGRPGGGRRASGRHAGGRPLGVERGRCGRRGVGGGSGPLRRRTLRPARRGRERRGRGRWRAGPPAQLDEWHRVIDVNLTGTFLVAKHAVARCSTRSRSTASAVDREHRQHRGPRGHRRRQRLQRVEGRRRARHQNLAIDYGPPGIRPTRSVPASSTRR